MDLARFSRLLLKQRVIEAISHLGLCRDPECDAMYLRIRSFLLYNPDYPFMIVDALVGCRRELFRKSAPIIG